MTKLVSRCSPLLVAVAVGLAAISGGAIAGTVAGAVASAVSSAGAVSSVVGGAVRVRLDAASVASGTTAVRAGSLVGVVRSLRLNVGDGAGVLVVGVRSLNVVVLMRSINGEVGVGGVNLSGGLGSVEVHIRGVPFLLDLSGVVVVLGLVDVSLTALE